MIINYSTKSHKSVKRLLKFHVKSAHLVDQVTKMPKDLVRSCLKNFQCVIPLCFLCTFLCALYSSIN